MRKVLFFLLLMLFAVYTSSYGQDPYFSQFYNTPMLLNPALTGITYGNVRLIAHYKRYLATIDPFETYSFTADMSIMEGKPSAGFGGVGLMVMSNSSGANLKNTQAMGSFSYHFALGHDEKQFLSLGVQGGLNQTKLDLRNLSTQTQWITNVGYDPSVANGEPVTNGNVSLVDFQAGLLYYAFPSEKFSWFAGAAAFHLTEPDGSFTGATSTLSRRYVGHAGFRAELGPRVALLPNVSFMQQNGINLINAGMAMDYMFNADVTLQLSAWARNTDIVIFGGGLDYKNIRISLSYDMLVSDLSDLTNRGGFEFCLTFFARKKVPSVNKLSANPTPRL
ncbi:MAG TPA: PorP/SprF family type IX secretion system membrane protein [Cyclobacteriaceae bacterium]|nr:PorP/SprF family type IX secretion system membrane protein [Cyclobacteriaceae bacterium]